MLNIGMFMLILKDLGFLGKTEVIQSVKVNSKAHTQPKRITVSVSMNIIKVYFIIEERH